MSKYGHRTHNWFEAIVNKIGGEDRAEAFLRGELMVSKKGHRWREYDGVICFSVTSDGATGEEWIERLENRGFHVGDSGKSVLRSRYFEPTNGIMTEVVVLKSVLLKNQGPITTSKIRAEADKRGNSLRKLVKPNAEIACLIREEFTDEEIEAMGLLVIAAMHEPIRDSDGIPLILYASRRNGGYLFGAHYADPEDGWLDVTGAAFAVA